MSNEWSKKVFANNLKKYMELSGETQKELAAIAGVTEATFSEYMNSKTYPRIDKIQKIADHFGILKSDLIEDKQASEKAEITIKVPNLTSDELALLEAYRSLNKYGQEKVMDYIADLRDSPKNLKGDNSVQAV